MKTTWIVADQIISPLGITAEMNYDALLKGVTGIRRMDNSIYSKEAVYLGAIDDETDFRINEELDSPTRFEKFVFVSIREALQKVKLDTESPRVVFILSTTKGNIELLEQGKRDSPLIHLPATARKISQWFGNPIEPIVVSNACVSGVTAILLAKHLLETGQYDHAVVTGADVLSRFVVSGFQCLSALSSEPCKPFDKKRKGTTLGEAAGTVILSALPEGINANPKIRVIGGGLSNDANHISGPSRTGEELSMAIKKALGQAELTIDQIDFISAHGTATLFNDEMEAKAFHQSGLSNTPLNSLKGYFGHTLGAAGVVESVISIYSLTRNELIPTFGFEELGVSVPVNIQTKVESGSLNICLKTASGFGGCNAAMVLQKV